MAAAPLSLHSKPGTRSSYDSSIYTSNSTHPRGATPARFALLRTEGYGYTAVDPYAASISQSIQNIGYSRADTDSSLEDIDVPDNCYSHCQLPYQQSILTVSVGKDKPENTEPYTLSTYVAAFTLDTLPRLIYSCVLLRLPSLYFSRVARVFEDADLTLPEIKRMALELANQHPGNVHQVLFTNLSHHAPATSPFWNLKTNWESFIESLLREWKTLNIISVLLLGAILTVLQIDIVAIDPLTRYSALLSLVCALMSLLYGCIFIIRFGGMKKPHKAAEWAWEARRTRTMIWWNVWVMLAMPAVWLSWSVVAYIICIMGIVWRTGSTRDGLISPLEPRLAFWPRLFVSLMLGLGIVYFTLITTTLSRYGSSMDKKWRDRVKGWTDRLIFQQPFPEHIGAYPHTTPWSTSMHNTAQRKESDDSYSNAFVPPRGYYYTHSPSPIPPTGGVEGQTEPEQDDVNLGSQQPGLPAPVQTYKAVVLRFNNADANPLPSDIEARHVSAEVWTRFITETGDAWDNPFLPGSQETTPQASVLRVISMWNASVFAHLCIEAILCKEYYPEWPESPLYAVYLIDRQPILGRALDLEERFGPVPRSLARIDILNFSNLEHNWITLFPERDTEVHFNTPRPSSRQHTLRRGLSARFQVRGDGYDNDGSDKEVEDYQDEEKEPNVIEARSVGSSFSSPSPQPPTPPRSEPSKSQTPYAQGLED